MITEENISKLQDIFQEDDLIDDEELEEMKEQKNKMYFDNLILSKLLIKTYNYLFINRYLIKDKDLLFDFNNELKKFKKSKVILSNLLKEYGDGKEYGDYYLSQNISDYINKRKQEYIGFVFLFFRLFVGEE